MKIELAEQGRMAQTGSALLRLFQNQTVPLLDLVVRESIQNSLDAAIQGKSGVHVDIRIGSFNPRFLNKHLEGIQDELDSRYALRTNQCKFISFGDKDTIGLTGPVRYRDLTNGSYGNLLKLVYEISKPQEIEGAG